MTQGEMIEAVLVVQHNKNMYTLGTALVDPAVLKRIDVEAPPGLDVTEVIACHFTFGKE